MQVLQTYPSSSGKTTHEVREGGDGVIYCTCPGWRFNKHCKHLDMWHAHVDEAMVPVKKDSLSEIIEEVVTMLGGANG